MPSLFGRRSRSVSTSRPTTSASSSAHLAAAQAFLANQPSSSNLSASAAAAALRTMSPAPTPVDQVQTKRMLNRQTSNSSIASAPRGRSRGGAVQRRPSAGSMTERTFRSPSPGQNSPQTAPVSGVGRGAPPVPPLPQNFSTEDLPPVPSKTHRRSASMDVMPARVSSPPVTRTARKGQNQAQAPPVNTAAAVAARRSANLPPSAEMKRSDSQDSRNSYNFSYPRGSRPNSPPPRSPITSSHEALPVAAKANPAIKATNGISAAEAARIQHELAQTAARPVKVKKKRVEQSAAEGSHLQSGTVGGKPKATPLEPLPADYQPPTTTQEVKKPKKKAALTGQSTHFPGSEEASAVDDAASTSDNKPESPKDKRAQRASGILAKQPSVVREDWEGEQGDHEASPVETTPVKPSEVQSTVATASTQPKRMVPEANMSRKIEDPSSTLKNLPAVYDSVTIPAPQGTETNKPLQSVTAASQTGRGVSISPSRSTRFSDRLASDLASGRKHEPLGRSISPAKSALKHSSLASDSPTDGKFSQRRGSSVTPSETSDASTEGLSGRRKSSRVSFEGFSDVKDSLADVRAQREAKNQTRSGSRNKVSQQGVTSTDDEEEGLKPRPALPSFGSVRRSERSASPNNKKATTTEGGDLAEAKTASSSETSSIADPPTMDTSISSDHAIGGLLYKNTHKNLGASSEQRVTEPLAPQVTSVEGTGYASDSESVYSEDEAPFKAARNASQQLGKSIGHAANSSQQSEEIPVIAVQPATPGLEEQNPEEDWAKVVPGGFPITSASNDLPLQNSSEGPISTATYIKEHNGLGLADAAQDYSSPNVREGSVSSSPQQLMTIAEEDSDASSLYSDAAEDLSDLEGDGFGSINAIVESPMAVPAPQRVVSPPESPLAAVVPKRPMEVERTASWDDTQARWSELAQRSRENNQQSYPSVHAITTESEVPAATPTTAEKTSIKAAPATSASPATAAPAARNAVAAVTSTKPTPRSQPQTSANSRVTNQPAPSTVVATKRTTGKQAQGNFRSSMRGDPEPMVKTMRNRPSSYAGPSSPPRGALQKKNIPSATAATVPKPPVRRFSNDSDSDSSFRKARRNRKPADGQFTMRRSMRSGPTEPEQSTAPAARADVRSLSPPRERRPTSPTNAKSMRTTMRGSMDKGTPTLRPQPETKRSSSWFSRDRKAKSPTRPVSAAVALPSKVKSRIADSDDEDEARPAHYKSRFNDSSDEDEPQTLRPVRGIPRKEVEGDSTDLDDSSDDQAKKTKTSGTPKKLAIVPPTADQEVVSPPLSPTTAKKQGFWSRIRGKKKPEEADSNRNQIITEPQDVKEDVDNDKEDSTDSKNLGFNSAAERDALIEQTRLKLEAAKEGPQSPTGRPGSPLGKLQRRVTPQRILSDSWAPPKMPAAQADRPQTSDGVDIPTRPAVGSRQATGENINGDGAAYGKAGKKKRFGLLRKAFGLND